MGILTSGKVTYGRTVRPAQYEGKKAEAEINFTALDDGSDFDIMFAKAASVAILKVHEMVGIAKPKATETAPAPAAPKAERTKADIEADHLEALGGKPAVTSAKPRVPRAAAKPAEEPKPQINTNPEDRVQEETFDDFAEEAPAAVVITDADLTSACTKANGIIKDGIAIRSLATECGATTGVSSIPANRRQEFLNKLSAKEAEAKAAKK